MAEPEAGPHDGNAHLRTLTERMRLAQGGTMPRDSVVVDEVVAAVRKAMTGGLSATEVNRLREVAGLGRIIDRAKVGAAEVSVDAIRASHIPATASELDAIVWHTGNASERIGRVCGPPDNLGAALSADHMAMVQGATIVIYEACSFQNITGRRITKMVKARQNVKPKVERLSILHALSVLLDGNVLAVQDPVSTSEAALTNGPPLPAAAMDQSDTDQLMADF